MRGVERRKPEGHGRAAYRWVRPSSGGGGVRKVGFPGVPLPPPRLPSYDADLADKILKAGPLPGLPEWLGLRTTELGPGRMVVELAVRDELLTPFGNLHGGVMAGLVDHILGAVLYPLLARGQWAATTEFKLNYLAPVQAGTLRAEATVVSLTKRTAVVRSEVTNDGVGVCVAQGTLLVVDPKPGAAARS
jgi:1,4-dihydroxy-2-naphthoyl-CoA hydrolase